MILSQLREATTNLFLHRGRTFLAALGIIFGVASVICMLSISEVARRDVIGRIERLGVRNVIIDSVKPERVRSREKQRSEESWLAHYGLTIKELDLLREAVGPRSEKPALDALVPMRILFGEVRTGSRTHDVDVVATTAEYPGVMAHEVREGRFLAPVDESTSAAVCVLGSGAARALFPLTSAIGQSILVGGVPFKVIGVMAPKGQTGSTGVLSNPDRAAWIPFETSFARFGRTQVRQGSGVSEATTVEINRAILRVADGMPLNSIAALVRSLMKNRHRDEDLAITIPSALLKERRQAEDVFRWVMASLAAISLLVGGVGIMNIMLANMAERRQEVGLRRAIGATRGDIVRLFVSEATVLCVFGSVVGVGLGAALAHLVGQLAQWTVAFEPMAFPLGVSVGVATGLLFGTLPAIKAARLDPVMALRVE